MSGTCATDSPQRPNAMKAAFASVAFLVVTLLVILSALESRLLVLR